MEVVSRALEPESPAAQPPPVAIHEGQQTLAAEEAETGAGPVVLPLLDVIEPIAAAGVAAPDAAPVATSAEHASPEEQLERQNQELGVSSGLAVGTQFASHEALELVVEAWAKFETTLLCADVLTKGHELGQTHGADHHSMLSWL